MTDIPELKPQQFSRAIPARTRKRILLGQIESGDDVVALRRFVGLTQARFAAAMGISVHTLRNPTLDNARRHADGGNAKARFSKFDVCLPEAQLETLLVEGVLDVEGAKCAVEAAVGAAEVPRDPAV